MSDRAWKGGSGRRVADVPELTVFGSLGGQADVPGYFHFGDLGTLDAYLDRTANDPFRGVAEYEPPPPTPPLKPAPPLQPVVPPAPPANEPIFQAPVPTPPRAAPTPVQVKPPPELVVSAPGLNARPLAGAAAASISSAIFAEVLLPYVYNLFGINYVPFLGVQPGGQPSTRARRRPDPQRAPGSPRVADLTELLVRGTRTAQQPSRSPAPLLSASPLLSILPSAAPTLDARSLVQSLLSPTAAPRTRPRAKPRVRPRVQTRLNLDTSPLQQLRNAFNRRAQVQPTFNLGPQFAQPLLPSVPPVNVPPTAAPRPSPGPAPSPYVPPFVSPLDMLQPGASTMAAPRPSTNRCCPCKDEKERKPRAPRTQCRQGTYTQTAKGIKYTPRRTVPCR